MKIKKREEIHAFYICEYLKTDFMLLKMKETVIGLFRVSNLYIYLTIDSK